MKSDALSIGVSIPSFNEEKNIESLLNKVINELAGVSHTICIVDDGSQDKTVAIIQGLMAAHPQIHLIQRQKTRSGCQRGGASFHALQWLLKNTEHTVIAEVDADGAHRPEEIMGGASCISQLGFDVVIASKYVYGSVVEGRPLGRRFVSLCYSLLARFFFNRRIRDYSNSFRFYSRQAGEHIVRLKPRYTSPIYLLEILVLLIAKGVKILELPTCYIERNSGSSKVKWIDLIKGALGMLAITTRFRFKKYHTKEP